MANEFHTLFNYRPMKDLAGFLTSYNCATQVVTFYDDGDDNDLTDTGTAMCAINGVVIPSLTQDAQMVIASDETGDAPDVDIGDDKAQYVAILADEDGTLSIWLAGDCSDFNGETQDTIDVGVLKMPSFDYETYVCLAVAVYNNDAAASAVGIGDDDCDWNTDGTFYQILGPVFPHPENIDLN